MVLIRHRTTNCKTVWVDSIGQVSGNSNSMSNAVYFTACAIGLSRSDEHGMGGATLQLAVSHTFNMGTDAVNPSTC